MKHTILPGLTPNTTPTLRKQSRANLDTLFSALVLILNLHEHKPLTYDLIAILNVIHNTLIAQLDEDPSATISLYKSLSMWFLEWLRGNRMKRGSLFGIEQWSTTHNCPRLLIELLPFLTTNVISKWLTDKEYRLMIQVTFALLQSYRVIVTELKPDYTTITSPGVETLPVYKSFIHALQDLGISPAEFQSVYNSKCASLKLRVVNTAGPNGQATWTAQEDGRALMAVPSLFKAFQAYAKASNLEWLVQQMVYCADAPMTLKNRSPNAPLVTGRIHAIEEWGGKTRLVAIVDYWTQALLTPLHDTINHFLKRLDSDGTFDQDKIISKVKEWTESPVTCAYSFDLSAATDRLPRDYQSQLLSHLFGNGDMAQHWLTLMAGREFITPAGTFIKYAVGQPMGSKSSFPMLALLHHVIVKASANMCKIDKYTKYVILGDDLTLTDGNVAEKYQDIMKSIGVPINLSKSVVHVDKADSAGEICKRIFIKGVELTAIPVKLLVKVNKSGYLASDLQNVLSKRDWAISKENFLNFLANVIDRKSLEGIIVLNAMPSSVTGLRERVDTKDLIDIKHAFGEALECNTTNLESAFTYALITEQLKRVDSLLRSTELMAQTIAHMSAPVKSDMWPSFLFDKMSPEDRATALAALPDLPWSHPIVSAALSEHHRVMSHLTALRSGTASMVSKAREGLLDILRNSLHEMWLGERERSAVVQRSVFNAALSALKKISEFKVTDTDTIPHISFSLLLTYVQRMWTVDWKWGEEVRINSVKSRVKLSVEESKTILNKVANNIKLKDIRL